MPRLRVPSLKVRQNAENVTLTVNSGTSKRGRGGRPRGSTSRRGGRKPKTRSAPWEEEEEIEQHYGYESHSEEDEDDDDFLVEDIEQPEVSEHDSEPESEEVGEIIKNEIDSGDIICPWVDEEASYPPLDLPESSCDIPVHPDLIMDMIELYEVFRSYRRTLRISAFTFEDFCAAMNSSDNSCLLSEIHMALLKICLKSDDEDQIHYSVNDTNNAFNIMVYSLDSMTYAEVLRQYLESDRNRLRVPIEILKAVNEPNYPFVDITIRVAVIAFLCYRFLDSAEYRKVVSNAGRFVNDDVCRVCGKGGVAQWCHNCEASAHLQCAGLTEKQEEWNCELCKLNEVRGVSDSLPFDHVKTKQPLRMEPLGRDRHGRVYWFVVRRLVIQDENESELFYYSTLPQLYELFSRMDPHFLEYNLCKTFCEQLQEIVEQMAITLEISNERYEAISNREIYKDNNITCFLHLDNVNRMKHILNDLCKNKGIKKEEDETTYQPLPDRLLPLLGVIDNRLTNSFWSGHYLENDVLNLDVTPFLEQKKYFLMGGFKLDDFYKKYRNHYNGHELADHPTLRKKIQDKKKYLSTRFAIIDEGEGMFQWSIARGRDMYGNDRLQAKYIEWTLARMAKKIPIEMMHRRWGEVSADFRTSLAKADNYSALSKVLLQMECCMRRTLFHPQFWSSLGHTRLTRTTVEDRDLQSKELQKKKKEERDLTMGEDDDESIVRVKYTILPSKACPQTLWRQRDEVYRVAGRGSLGGWMWVSKGLVRDVRASPKYILSEDMNEEEKTILQSKISRLASLSSRLLKVRALEEISKENKNQALCYSPSCRLGIPTTLIISSQLDLSQLCYSNACRSNYLKRNELNADDFKHTNTTLSANAFKKVNVIPSATNDVSSDVIWPLIKPNKFTCKSAKRKSILIVADNILRKLARTGGRKAIYIPNFSLSAKSNMTLWNYPCPRPCFDLCWRYLVTNARSLHAIALQLKILWFCVKWLEFEPGEEETDGGRLIVHQIDRDDIRAIVNHQELPPHGTYERYQLEIEALMLEDDVPDDDDDYSERSDRRASRASRPKRSSVRTSTRRIKETSRQWIDGVELKVFEIKKYWGKKLKQQEEKEQLSKPIFSWEKLPPSVPVVERYHSVPRAVIPISQHQRYTSLNVQHSSRLPLAQLQMERRKRPIVPTRNTDYAYDDVEFQDFDDHVKPSVAKRARIVFTSQESPASPNRRTSHGYEYSGGMIRGGGRLGPQPVGDGMRRVAISSGIPSQLGAEEVVASSGQTPNQTRVVRAAGGVDAPPNIERFDSPGSGYGSPLVTRPQPRQVVYSQPPVQRQTQNGKVLMIRRSDGSTQFLRPVNAKDGETTPSSSSTVIRAVVNQSNPSTSSDQTVMGGAGSVQRRIITTARPIRTAMVRPVDGAAKVLRIGQNGQQVVASTQSRVVSRVEPSDESFVKRVPVDKLATGNPGVMSGQPNVQLVRRPSRPVPIRTDQVYYGDNPSVDEYTQMAEQGIRPPGRPPARVAQAYGYGRPVQRIISRNSSGVPVSQVMQNGYRGSIHIANRRITSYKEFCMKRGIVDNMRLPSRPYRFEFESNEDEERAIAEAIAREEELMRQEEESKRGQTRNEHHWQHPRIINQYGQVGTNLFSQLSKQPLTYSSNLMPTKDDTPEQKSIKQMLDTIITQVCRWDKQHGWYKSHLKRPRNRFELDKIRSRRMFSNQREVMLAQHVDRLRKEINKRRTALENQAEEECGLLTPWRKSKGRGQKVVKRQQSPEQEAPRQVVNPAEISLGGDAVKWNEPGDAKKDDAIDDVDIENLIEVQSPQRRNERRSSNSSRWSPQPQKSPRKADKLRKLKEECSSTEESQSVVASPRRRGRPPKKPFDSYDMGSDDSDGGGRKKLRRPPPAGLDINLPHCICQKRYNPFRFYLACSSCNLWYHGKCVGISEEECDGLSSWTCPHCIQPKPVPLYCKCRTEYNDSEFYVGCDGCQGWFHPACVGITREFVEKISEYMCPDCSQARDNKPESVTRQEDGYESADSDSNNRVPLSRSDYPVVWKLFDQLCEHRMSWPFQKPIDEEEYPDYRKTILKPIDLSIIQKQLENLEYHTLNEFADDVRLMLQNAKSFFKEGTINICAETLEKIFETQVADVHNEIESRRTQDRRKPSESRTIDSSLDIDTDQLMDVMVDPAMYEQFIY